MDERDYDDERRVVQREKHVVLHDGREFSHKQIFNEFLKNGFIKDYMKEAMYRIIVSTPISIVFETGEKNGQEIDIERYFRKANMDERDKYTPASFTLNGISSDDIQFHEELKKTGKVFIL